MTTVTDTREKDAPQPLNTDAIHDDQSANSKTSVQCPAGTTEKKLMLRVDLHILPFLCIMYLLAFLGKSILSPSLDSSGSSSIHSHNTRAQIVSTSPTQTSTVSPKSWASRNSNTTRRSLSSSSPTFFWRFHPTSCSRSSDHQYGLQSTCLASVSSP